MRRCGGGSGKQAFSPSALSRARVMPRPALLALTLWWCSLLCLDRRSSHVAAAAVQHLATGSSRTAHAVPARCRKFSPNKIDYHDATIATINGVNNASACCAQCRLHNAARPAGSNPASTNCTIGVWYGCGPRKFTCALKSTANQPFKSTCVVALQPLELPPPAPPPPPLRFASIYTSHAVLAAAPARAVVWGFTITREQVTLKGVGGAEGTMATLSPVPKGSMDPGGDPYEYPYIWTVTLPAVSASFTPHTLVAQSATSESAISDVLFGDVWVCGGQSNMEYSVNGSNGEVIKHPPVNNSLSEIANMQNFDSVRLFRTGHQNTAEPMLEELPPHNGGSMDPVYGWTAPCLTVNGTKRCRVDFSAMCYFFGRNIYSMLAAEGKSRPIGMIQACWSGSPDEPWMPSSALDKCMKPPRKPGNGGMFNGMIRPLLNTTITGAIWYQGESDATHPGGTYDGYNCTFPAMIQGWREQWSIGTGGQTSRSFPFGFVQLNSVGNDTVYNNPADPTNGDPYSPAFGYAGLRWSQTAGYGYVPNQVQPNVFMAVSVDTPDRPFPFHSPLNGNRDAGCNVHSPFKQPTAARLARAGLASHYGMDFDTVTPLAGQLSHGRIKGELVLAIKNAGSGVSQLRSSKGFEALSAGHWVSCPATARTTSTVTVSGVPNGATKLRYNWWSNPCGLDVFGCAVYIDAQPLGHVFSGDFPFLPLPPFVADIPPAIWK